MKPVFKAMPEALALPLLDRIKQRKIDFYWTLTADSNGRFPATFRADVYNAIVGVTAERMPPLSQFLIQIVQHDIGQR